MSQAEVAPQILAHAEDDDLLVEMATLEERYGLRRGPALEVYARQLLQGTSRYAAFAGIRAV
jgi:hypothetical protein